MIYSGDTFYQPAMSMKTPQWHGAFDQDGPIAETSRRALADRLVTDKILCRGLSLPVAGSRDSQQRRQRLCADVGESMK